MKILILSAISLFLYSCGGINKVSNLDDVYINRLVYLKSDSSLFSGTIHINDSGHTADYSFANGLPCGEWIYRYNGDIIQKGAYLEKTIIDSATIKIIGQDTFAIQLMQEGEGSGTNSILAVEILKPDSFFDSNKSQYSNYFNNLANSIHKNVKKVDYSYIFLLFMDGFGPGSLMGKAYNKRYTIENGVLKDISDE